MRVLRRFCYGTIAGLTGAAAMHVFRLWWEMATCHRQRDAIFGFDRAADMESAYFIFGWLSRKRLSQQKAAQLGLAFHHGYGALLGALYAATHAHASWLSKGGGSAFGAVLWLCADEIPISLVGISGPCEKSVASHASALAAHIVFGVTVEQMLGSAIPAAAVFCGRFRTYNDLRSMRDRGRNI